MSAKEVRRRIETAAIARLGGGLLTNLLRTTGVETEGEENFRRFWDRGEATLFVLWHGRLLPCTWHHRGQGVVTLISQHRDGEYIARIVQGWGFTTVRGSSSRGGVEALRELARWLRKGRSLAITPDGPRGPREKMKLGPLAIAQLTGRPIIPTVGSANRAWWFGGWDRFLVPRPFARMRVHYGTPVWVPRKADEAELQRIADGIEAQMAEMTLRADAW